MKLIRQAAVAAAVLSVSAFAQGSKTNPSMKTSDMTSTGQGQTMQAMQKIDEKGLLERLHAINQEEIELGRLAEQRAQAQEVKDYARMMVQDHTQADQDLTKLASTRKLTLSKPTPMGDVEKKLMTKMEATTAFLKAADGAEFDSAYMTTMVGGHDHAILLVSIGMQKINTGESADMLRQLLPKLNQHRDHALSTLGTLKVSTGSMATGGSGASTGSMNDSDTMGSGSMGTGMGTGSQTGSSHGMSGKAGGHKDAGR